MAELLTSPYAKGNILTLKIQRYGSKNAPPKLKGAMDQLRAKIVNVVEPSTMSVVLLVELEPSEQDDATTAPPPRMMLKVYDRQFSPELREFKDTGPASTSSEGAFTAFVQQGSMSRFLADLEESGEEAYDEWDVPKREAYFYARTSATHEIELEVYDRLVEMQGTHVPTIFADVRLAPSHGLPEQDESITKYTEARAILMEYIDGFPLDEVVTEAPESDWAPICDQAIDVIREIADNDFLNFDIKTRNILVRRDGQGSYQVFFLDFGGCRFRNASDCDEIWRERKRQKDEEGAVGSVMMNHISRAKGKKGKKYKGPLPLPWEYRPSSRFDGDYIELYEDAD